MIRHLVRVGLGIALVAVGITHFTNTDEFLAQTPSFLPWRTAIIWLSGVVEIVLGALLVFDRRHRREVGIAAAAFFVLVFPGNIYQAVAGIDAFSLDTDAERWARLAFQPVLIAAALWSTRESS